MIALKYYLYKVIRSAALIDTYLRHVPFLVGKKKSLIIRSAPLIELTSQPESEAAYLSPRSSVRTIKIDIFFRLSFASWEATAITVMIDIVFYIV